MENKVLKAPNVTDEIISVIRSNLDRDELIEKLNDYHENDIAQSLEYLTKQERLSLYDILGDEWVSDILAYVEEPEQYIDELGVKKLADIINEMDSDDAADLLEKVDERIKEKLRPNLDDDVKADIQLINSYDEDEIGSLITTNYICISKTLDIRCAMHELIRQAGDNDNISTIYVTDENAYYIFISVSSCR